MGYGSYPNVPFSDLVGKTLTEISGAEAECDEVTIKTADGLTYRMNHYQDCCEYVRVKEVVGDIADLIGTPILEAEEVSQEADTTNSDDYYSDSGTWTFYKLGTIKGRVTISWLGESNGYYSESVDFELITSKNEVAMRL